MEVIDIVKRVLEARGIRYKTKRNGAIDIGNCLISYNEELERIESVIKYGRKKTSSSNII
jgi:hypothetical protein